MVHNCVGASSQTILNRLDAAYGKNPDPDSIVLTVNDPLAILRRYGDYSSKERKALEGRRVYIADPSYSRGRIVGPPYHWWTCGGRYPEEMPMSENLCGNERYVIGIEYADLTRPPDPFA